MNPYSPKKLIFVLIALLITPALHGSDIQGGMVIGRNIYGVATDYQGDPVLIEERALIYGKSSFDKLISFEEKDFMISGFNHHIGGVYVTQVDSKTKNKLDTMALDLANVEGLSYPTGGIKTPWDSVLLTESGLIDAGNAQDFISAYKPYFKNKDNLVNPYNYGWISEVIVLDAQGQSKVIKNYALGRVFANEIMMMPDGKTFYMLDSLNSGNLYLFIAEQANSLAQGALYGVSRQQGRITHIPLGDMSALKMKFKLNKIEYDAIFETAETANQACAEKFTYVNTVYGEECLKVKSKNKNYAGLFEPIRSMALKGGQSIATGLTGMRFDTEKTQIRFKKPDDSEIALTVGQNPQLGSQFIIQE